jgi:hypothetical protein
MGSFTIKFTAALFRRRSAAARLRRRWPTRQPPLARCSLAHFGKNVETGTKGSSDFENDADVVLALLGQKARSGAVTNPYLSVRKRRNGPNGEQFAFRTKVADLGLDEHGFPITTLTIEWQPETDTKPKTEAWSKSLRLLRQVLMNSSRTLARIDTSAARFSASQLVSRMQPCE